MTPKFGRMIAVFSAPPDLPWSRPVLAVPAPCSQDMRIKYMFIVQRYFIVPRYGLMRAAARRSFAPRMWSLTGIAGFGGSPTGRSGALGRSDRRGRRASGLIGRQRVRRTVHAHSLHGNTVRGLTWRGAGPWKCWSVSREAVAKPES
jgi:hypothetical protein